MCAGEGSSVSLAIQRRIQAKTHTRTIKTIRRSNKLIECLKLPSVLNINPRSVYNKIDNLKTYIIVNEIELTCISESWERPEYPLDKLFDLDDDVFHSIPGNAPPFKFNQTVVHRILVCQITPFLFDLSTSDNFSSSQS